MIVGVPKEIKTDEYRVGMIPAGVGALCDDGHTVFVQKGAGVGSGIEDAEYADAGAEILDSAPAVWKKAEMIVKVKEPLPEEYPLMRKDQTLFTYFHFAANEQLTDACMDADIVAIAYETIRDGEGRLPLLTPMSEIAGRMAPQQGAKYLERPQGGRGVLLSGVPGVMPAKVAVLGGGIVGTNAAKIAAGMGANVFVLDINPERLRYLDDILPGNVTTLMSDTHTIRESISEADLVIGAVLIEGARAPRLVKREDLKLMKAGSVIVDVAIDQGGCIETSRPTTHSDPTYVVDDVVHYCVANMPGAVSRTSTFALTNCTIPYARKIARLGWKDACAQDNAILHGLNVAGGRIVNQAVADTFDKPCASFGDVA